METLKYAILGLLMKKDMTGYELTKEFNSALFEFWNASHSQIYPKLKALTKEGLIEYHIEITGTVLEKKVYTITDAGKEAFKKWEETLYPMPSLPKDEFRLQLFFSHLASPEFRIQLLHDQLSQHLDLLQYPYFQESGTAPPRQIPSCRFRLHHGPLHRYKVPFFFPAAALPDALHSQALLQYKEDMKMQTWND